MTLDRPHRISDVLALPPRPYQESWTVDELRKWRGDVETALRRDPVIDGALTSVVNIKNRIAEEVQTIRDRLDEVLNISSVPIESIARLPRNILEFIYKLKYPDLTRMIASLEPKIISLKKDSPEYEALIEKYNDLNRRIKILSASLSQSEVNTVADPARYLREMEAAIATNHQFFIDGSWNALISRHYAETLEVRAKQTSLPVSGESHLLSSDSPDPLSSP